MQPHNFITSYDSGLNCTTYPSREAAIAALEAWAEEEDLEKVSETSYGNEDCFGEVVPFEQVPVALPPCTLLGPGYAEVFDTGLAIQPDPSDDDEEGDAFVLHGARAYVRLKPSLIGANREVKLFDDQNGVLTIEYSEGTEVVLAAAIDMKNCSITTDFPDNSSMVFSYDRPEPES